MVIPKSDPKIPSRYTNPFATCWTSKLEYVEGHCSVDEVHLRWKDLGQWGAIVGPHGTGKSTLLRTLKDRLRSQGEEPEWITLRSSEQLNLDFLNSTRPLVLLEGLERLSLLRQFVLLGQLRRRDCRVLATLHSDSMAWPWQLKTVRKTEVSTELVKLLFNRLVDNDDSRLVAWCDALECWQHRNGDLRELWFELYELYESRRNEGHQLAEQPAFFVRTVAG